MTKLYFDLWNVTCKLTPKQTLLLLKQLRVSYVFLVAKMLSPSFFRPGELARRLAKHMFNSYITVNIDVLQINDN